jgi:hypothetical protein
MIATIVGILIFLIVGVVSFVFNKQLSKHFAKAFFSISWWMFPPRFRRDYYYFVIYRVFFYAVSVFCFVVVIFFTVLVISNIH